MERSKPPSFVPFLLSAIILIVIGWGGLIVLVNVLPPDLGPRWLFYFFFTFAFTGLFLPLVYFIRQRFSKKKPVENSVIVREALWFGIYAGAVTWLQWAKLLSPLLAISLAGILVLIECLLRMRERSLWKPGA